MAFPTTNVTEELPAINQILASVGQAPVTTLDSTNPDVAIAYNTLLQVSREVQGEGWTFNREFDYPLTPDADDTILYPNNVLQMDLTDYGPTKGNNKYKNTIRRSGPYTVFATKIDVVENGTGGGTEGWVLNKTVTTTEAGIDMTVNISIDASGQADRITVVKPGSNYLLQDKITIAKASTGTTDDVIGIISETTPERGLLYDREKHSFKFTDEKYYFDITWFFDWVDVPGPIQDYITARATSFFVSRVLGDPTVYRMSQEKEQYCRAVAMEYECNQGQYTFFGHPHGGNHYNSYQPYKALQR